MNVHSGQADQKRVVEYYGTKVLPRVSRRTTPFGVLTPASWMALNATRYMHTYGVTSEDFGRAVVQLRDYAATNPNAHFYGTRITLDDHQSSRWIAEPAIRPYR